jgi:hypothetical protein
MKREQADRAAESARVAERDARREAFEQHRRQSEAQIEQLRADLKLEALDLARFDEAEDVRLRPRDQDRAQLESGRRDVWEAGSDPPPARSAVVPVSPRARRRVR